MTDYDDLMPPGSTKAEQEIIKQERLAQLALEEKEYLEAQADRKVTTVEELIVKLLQYPPTTKVVTPDPGCGCCSDDEPVAVLVDEADGVVWLGNSYHMPES